MIAEVYTPLRLPLVRTVMGTLDGSGLRQLQRLLREYFGAEPFLFSSAKAGLVVALRASRTLSGRDLVVVPAYTCPQLLDVIARAGCQVALCDVACRSFCLDLSHLETILATHKVSAVVPCHLFGIIGSTVQLHEVSARHGARVVHDYAQAFPSLATERAAFSHGAAGVISFGLGKVVTAMGGGVLVSNDSALTEEIRSEYAGIDSSRVADDVSAILLAVAYRAILHPAVWHYAQPMAVGTQRSSAEFPLRRMSRACGSVGAHMLPLREQIQSERAAVARRILGAIGPQSVAMLPQECHTGEHRFLRLPLLLPDAASRNRALATLRSHGIGASKVYGQALACHGSNERATPHAIEVANRLLALPLSRFVTDAHIAFIDETIRLCMNGTIAEPETDL